MTDLDPKFTFDSFVVGPANRLASAAARRAAESPGTSYNPLFVYSASGLGKSHILNSIAHQSLKVSPARRVAYMALETYLDQLAEALTSGNRDGFRDRFGHLEILLLDDVQFLTGQPEAQEMLLRTLDQLSTAGSQIVLASDRPPADINGLDARLLSRFSGGLIVDIGTPEYETRVAIIRKKADERGHTLMAGVAETMARFPFKNVRELGGSLNKVFATQDLEGRLVSPDEVSELLGVADTVVASPDEFDSFLEDLSGAVAETVEAAEDPWRKAFREAIDAVEREGYSGERLKRYQGGPEPEGWHEILGRFRTDVQRLRDIDEELDRLGNPWPDLAQGVLKDPDRLDEAEALVTSVRERQRPFPHLGEGLDLEGIEGFPAMAVKAAEQLVGTEKPEYNPLYLWSADPSLAQAVLGAAGRSYQKAHPMERMAVTSVEEFAEDFIRALGQGVAGAWRERWWTVDLLLVHGVEALSETERAQDEFFHLFEALKRRGARVLFTADRPPAGIGEIDDRLRSRFEGGLVLEVDSGTASGTELALVEPVQPAARPAWTHASGDGREVIPPLDEVVAGGEGLFVEGGAPGTEVASRPEPVVPDDTPLAAATKGGIWYPSPENVVIHWPKMEELLLQELES